MTPRQKESFEDLLTLPLIALSIYIILILT